MYVGLSVLSMRGLPNSELFLFGDMGCELSVCSLSEKLTRRNGAIHEIHVSIHSLLSQMLPFGPFVEKGPIRSLL